MANALSGSPQWFNLNFFLFAGAAGSTNETDRTSPNGQVGGVYAQTAVSFTSLTGPQGSTTPAFVSVNGTSYMVPLNGGGAAGVPGIISYALGLASGAGWVFTA